MDKIGLADRATNAVVNIARGRRGFATIGRENEGGPPYHQGLTEKGVYQKRQRNLDAMQFVYGTFQRASLC